MLIFNYNVTMNFDDDLVSFASNKIIVDPVPEYPEFKYFFGVLMAAFIIMACVCLYMVLYRKGKNQVAVIEE